MILLVKNKQKKIVYYVNNRCDTSLVTHLENTADIIDLTKHRMRYII